MRVLFCKIACPSFVCFCKPSQSIYTTDSLGLESTSHAPSASALSSASSDTSSDHEISCSASGTQLIKESALVNGEQSNGDQNCLKSSIKRATDRHGSQDAEKKAKKVQWVDVSGKQLAEVREYESGERDTEIGYHSSRSCLCTIL